jgi:hypothetical protein
MSSEDLDLFAEFLIEDDDVKHDLTLTPSDTAESIAAQFLRDKSRLLFRKKLVKLVFDDVTAREKKKNCVVDFGLFAKHRSRIEAKSEKNANRQ